METTGASPAPSPFSFKECTVAELLVMVIDEDPDTQNEMCDLLKDLGVRRLLCSDNPGSALDFMSSGENADQVDILMTNCELSRFPLAELIAGVKHRKPDTIIITYSSCEDPTTHARALIIGASDYFKKTVGYEKLVLHKLNSWIQIATRNCEFHSMGVHDAQPG